VTVFLDSMGIVRTTLPATTTSTEVTSTQGARTVMCARILPPTAEALRALDNVPVSPTSSAPSPSTRPGANGSRPRAPKPPPTVGPDLRSLLPIH
jgi:hypothetical protein